MACVTNESTSASAKVEVVLVVQGCLPDSPPPANGDTIVFKQYHPDFEKLIPGENPQYAVILSSADSSRNPFFESCCMTRKGDLFATSDLLRPSSSSMLPLILISNISLQSKKVEESTKFTTSCSWQKLRPPPQLPLPSSAVQYLDGTLFCSQGTLTDPDSGGLWYMPHGKQPQPILRRFLNRPFNSIHSVAVERSSGFMWFTDPCIGFEKGIRPKPQLPPQVYFFDGRQDVRVVADGFGRPTGIALSPDERTLYVTDTEDKRPDGTFDPTLAATIYAYDVVTRAGCRFLANKRVFAMALSGVPKAVICDDKGNVYSACGDGVEIFSAGGQLLGVIQVLGGCSSLCFGSEGQLFICAGQRLFQVQLGGDQHQG